MTAKPLTGRKVLLILLAAFGIVLGANGIMMWQAARTYDGVVAEDVWQRGRAHDSLRAEALSQPARAWRLDILESSQAGTMIRLAEADGRPLDGLELSGSFVSPVDAAEDRALAATPLGEGCYRLAADLPRPGNWRLTIEPAGDVENTWRIERDLVVGTAASLVDPGSFR